MDREEAKKIVRAIMRAHPFDPWGVLEELGVEFPQFDWLQLEEEGGESEASGGE